MSEPAPNRTITGFGARPRSGGVHPDASRLLARNRTTQPAPEASVSLSPPATVAPIPPAPTPPAPAAARRPTKAKEQLNVAVPRDVRARIRAAYRATAHTEGHTSFSDLISAVLDAEATRLEQQYNEGRPFTGGEQPLPPGRPLEG
ncbi:ParB family protein [Cellulomonas carbonis]|uniref:ParB family protein n=1 Tax=Cellulomonas carbonis TaxID=1386092 RepID=UPI0016636ED5|nr:hypothetical protein [Cellulomonas carbonis]GGC17620.1 hypothetical protein GCM10010972_33610 [Cellulomonas carbonis]